VCCLPQSHVSLPSVSGAWGWRGDKLSTTASPAEACLIRLGLGRYGSVCTHLLSLPEQELVDAGEGGVGGDGEVEVVQVAAERSDEAGCYADSVGINSVSKDNGKGMTVKFG